MGNNLYTLFVLILLTCNSSLAAVQEAESEQQRSNLVLNHVKMHKVSASEAENCSQITTDDQNWEEVEFTEIPQNARFCLRVWIDIQHDSFPLNPTIILAMSSASNIYWDNQLLLSNGKVGDSALDEQPGEITTLVRIPDTSTTEGKHLLAIEASTFHVGASLTNIAYLLMITDLLKIQDLFLYASLIIALLMGALLILAVIFQFLYWLYHKDLAFQIFSLLCFTAAALLLAEQWKIIYFYSYDWHIFRLLLILWLTIITSFLLPCFYLFYYRSSFIRSWLLLIGICLVLSSLIVPGFEVKSFALFAVALVFSLVINMLAIRDKYHGAKLTTGLLLISSIGLVTMPFIFTEVGFGVVFTLIVLLMLISLIKEMRNHREKALTSARMQSELLRRNLQPHFLMNSLTLLMELIDVKPKEAIAFIIALATEFRLLVKYSGKDFILLTDEIALCRSHLKIMSYRYQQDYQLIVIGNIDKLLIPSAVLHSQIENCFTHNRVLSEPRFELHVSELDKEIKLLMKTPLGIAVEHQSTGIGENYINAKLTETCANKWQLTSLDDGVYWLTEISYLRIDDAYCNS